MDKFENISVETEIKNVQDNSDLLEDLFACEVVDTAYTCHENRNGGRRHYTH